jgi:hypothetical protein
MFLVPELVSVTVWALLLPTVTFPKLKLVGLAPSRSVPVLPESVTVGGKFVALLAIETLPVSPPTAVGAKATVNDVLPPAAKATGNDSPLSLKPVPAPVAFQILTLVAPVLATFSVWPVLVLPTTTLLKLRLAGVPESRAESSVSDD